MDKLIHFGVTFLVSMIISFAFPTQPLIAVGTTAGLSIGKETGDYFNPYSHGYFGDLLADGVGITVGVIAGLYLRRILDK